MKQNKKIIINVDHIAKLANLPLTSEQEKALQKTLTDTLEYVSQIQLLNTDNISETNQVTNLHNVYRKDKITPERVLSQSEALSNAKKTHKGYFVVSAVIET